MAKEAGPFNFWLRFGSVTGFFETCSFAKASPKVKNPGSKWLYYFLNRSRKHESGQGPPMLKTLAREIIAGCRHTAGIKQQISKVIWLFEQYGPKVLLHRREQLQAKNGKDSREKQQSYNQHP